YYFLLQNNIKSKRIVSKRSSGEDRSENDQLQESDESLKELSNGTKKNHDTGNMEEDLAAASEYDESLMPSIFGTSLGKAPPNPTDILDSKSNKQHNQPVLLNPSIAKGGKINEDYPKGDSDNGNSSMKGGIADWVFIAMGIAIAFVVVSLFLLSYMYKARLAQLQKKPGVKEETENAITLLSHNSHEDNSQHDGDVMLTTRSAMNCSTPDNYDRFSTTDEIGFSSNSTHLYEMASLETSYSKIFTRCLNNEDTKKDRTESTGSIYSMVKNDGNKLRGGNMDFQRRYVENPYLGDGPTVQSDAKKSRQPRQFEHLQLKSGNFENGWNGSSASSTTSHHSARSYISIPPTSPSDNYIEVGSDCMSVHSMKSSPPIKMEWLTKSFSLDKKNELATYQASTGVQTEDSVSPPISKTVLGTPWQFGGSFTHKGGVLQARGSDVVLSVPLSAVPRGQAVDIYGSVFTDTADIRRKIEFPSFESLITPVVEYLALPVIEFKRPLHLNLPHSLSAEFAVNSIKVYTFSVDELGNVTTRCLPLKGQAGTASNQEAFWEKNQDGNKILITTSHFSGYFCTLCESTSLPSICTMVFGSHVQISEHRREIRVILYIWDRRLTIRDYLKRFQKQESEVDRQLLTDMQVPLLNNASSDSRLVMRMEIMGAVGDKQNWRHVARPGGSRLLFKPLQVRRLSEIVQCCRQTDPVRVEWALENHPDVAPDPVFQCCIDILHTPESVCDYETALSEDLDDLMRTFYVRDLKVVSKRADESRVPTSMSGYSALKRTLSEALDLEQTEQLCRELGITSKDIGNFHKKFPNELDIQAKLVEECARRFGHEKFVSVLPTILDKLHLSHLLEDAERELKQHSISRVLPSKSVLLEKRESEEQESSLTALKSLYFRDDDASNRTNKNKLKSDNISVQHHNPAMHQHGSERSDHLSHTRSLHDFGSQDNEGAIAMGNIPTLMNKEAALSLGDAHGIDVGAEPPQFGRHCDNDHHHQGATNNKLNSSSGYISVSQEGLYAPHSSQSLLLTHRNNLHLLEKFSVVAHADTLEMPQSIIGPQLKPVSQHRFSSDNHAYPEITEELCASSSGPQTLAGQKLHASKDSNLDEGDDKDQTSKKEIYDMHTVV
ncbi:hypothetical protein EGW08_020162, partial [Elysia chlorotica]